MPFKVFSMLFNTIMDIFVIHISTQFIFSLSFQDEKSTSGIIVNVTTCPMENWGIDLNSTS